MITTVLRLTYLACAISFIAPVSSRVISKRAAFYIANETMCIVDGEVFRNGDPVPTDDHCERCTCRPPGFSCVLRDCDVKPGCKAVRRDGECCPEYVCGCVHSGKIYEDGEIIKDIQNPCYTCRCHGSSISCVFADCLFRGDCVPEYVSGECCPRYDHCPPLSTTPSPTVFTTSPPTISPSTYTETVKHTLVTLTTLHLEKFTEGNATITIEDIQPSPSTVTKFTTTTPIDERVTVKFIMTSTTDDATSETSGWFPTTSSWLSWFTEDHSSTPLSHPSITEDHDSDQITKENAMFIIVDDTETSSDHTETSVAETLAIQDTTITEGYISESTTNISTTEKLTTMITQLHNQTKTTQQSSTPSMDQIYPKETITTQRTSHDGKDSLISLPFESESNETSQQDITTEGEITLATDASITLDDRSVTEFDGATAEPSFPDSTPQTERVATELVLPDTSFDEKAQNEQLFAEKNTESINKSSASSMASVASISTILETSTTEKSQTTSAETTIADEISSTNLNEKLRLRYTTIMEEQNTNEHLMTQEKNISLQPKTEKPSLESTEFNEQVPHQTSMASEETNTSDFPRIEDETKASSEIKFEDSSQRSPENHDIPATTEYTENLAVTSLRTGHEKEPHETTSEISYQTEFSTSLKQTETIIHSTSSFEDVSIRSFSTEEMETDISDTESSTTSSLTTVSDISFTDDITDTHLSTENIPKSSNSIKSDLLTTNASEFFEISTSPELSDSNTKTEINMHHRVSSSQEIGSTSFSSSKDSDITTSMTTQEIQPITLEDTSTALSPLSSENTEAKTEILDDATKVTTVSDLESHFSTKQLPITNPDEQQQPKATETSTAPTLVPLSSTDIIKLSTEDPKQNNEATLSSLTPMDTTKHDATLFAEEAIVDIFKFTKFTRATEDDTFEKTKSQSYTFTEDTTASVPMTEKDITANTAIQTMAAKETATSEKPESISTPDSKVLEFHTANSDINSFTFDSTVSSSISDINNDEPNLTTIDNSFVTAITSDSNTRKSEISESLSPTEVITTSVHANTELSMGTPLDQIIQKTSPTELETETSFSTLLEQKEAKDQTTTKQTSTNEINFSEMGNSSLTFFTTTTGSHLFTDTSPPNHFDLAEIQEIHTTENTTNEYKTNTDETTSDMLEEKIFHLDTQETSKDSFLALKEEFISATAEDGETLSSSEKGETSTPFSNSLLTTTQETTFNSSTDSNVVKSANPETTEIATNADETKTPIPTLLVTNIIVEEAHDKTAEHSSTESFDSFEIDTTISSFTSPNHQFDTYEKYDSSELNDLLIKENTPGDIVKENATVSGTRDPDVINTTTQTIIDEGYDVTTADDIRKISEVTYIRSTPSKNLDDESRYNSEFGSEITINTENTSADKYFTTLYPDKPERATTFQSKTTSFENLSEKQYQSTPINFIPVEKETISERHFTNDVSTMNNDMAKDRLQTNTNRQFESDTSMTTMYKLFDKTTPEIPFIIKTTTEKLYEKTKRSDLGDKLPSTVEVTESVFDSVDENNSRMDNTSSTTATSEHSATSTFSSFNRNDEKSLTDETYIEVHLSPTSTALITKTKETPLLSEEIFPDETSEKGIKTDHLISKQYESTITIDNETISHSSPPTDVIKKILNGQSTPEEDTSENIQHKTTLTILEQNFTSNSKMISNFVNVSVEDYYSTDYDTTNKTNDEVLDSINLDLLGESIIIELMKGSKNITGNIESETPKSNEIPIPIRSTVSAEFFSAEPRETSVTEVSTSKSSEDYAHFLEDELEEVIRKEIQNIKNEMTDDIKTNETLKFQEFPGIWYGMRTELPNDTATSDINRVSQNMSNNFEKIASLVTVTENKNLSETQNNRNSTDNENITLDSKSQLGYSTLPTSASPSITEKEILETEHLQEIKPTTPFPINFANSSNKTFASDSSTSINITDDLLVTEEKLGANSGKLTFQTKKKDTLTDIRDITDSSVTMVTTSIKMETSTVPQKSVTKLGNDSAILSQNKNSTSEVLTTDSEISHDDESTETKDKESQAGPEKGGDWFEPTLRAILKNNTETKPTFDDTELQTIQFTEFSSQPTTTVEIKPVTYESIENGPEKGGEWFEPDLPLVLGYNKNILETKRQTETSTSNVVTDVKQEDAVTSTSTFENAHNGGLESITINTPTENQPHSSTLDVFSFETKLIETQPPLPILLRKVDSNESIATTTQNIESSEEKSPAYHEYVSNNSTKETSHESTEYNFTIQEISKPPAIKLDNHESLKSVALSENLSSKLSQIYHILLAKDPASDIEIAFQNSTANKPDKSPVKKNDFLKIPDDIPLVEGFAIKSGDFFAVTSSLIIVAPNEEANETHANDSRESQINNTTIIQNITVQDNRTNTNGSETFSESHRNSSKRPENVLFIKPASNSTTTNTLESTNAFTEIRKVKGKVVAR